MKQLGFRKLWTLGLFLALLACSGPAMAQAITVTYQGVLRDSGGASVPDDNYPMTFSIWDAVTGGTSLWSENQGAVPAADGAFSAELGSVIPLGTLFTDNSTVQLWLEVSADTGSGSETYSPRIALSRAPYAAQATEADSASSVPWTGITSVPAGFADNTDDVDGGVAASVPWTGITNRPPGLDDGDDIDGGNAATVPWLGISSRPAGLDDGDDIDGGNAATVPWLGISSRPAGLDDGDDIDGGNAATVPWLGISGKPAGFADNVDDVDGGVAASVPWGGIVGVPADLADGDDVDGGAAASVPWLGISSRPAGLDDGDDIDGGNADTVDGLHAIDLAPALHNHAASQITSGTLIIDRLPVGTAASQVARGDHAHALNDLSNVNAVSPTSGDVVSWDGSQWVSTDSPAPGSVREVCFSGAASSNQQINCRVQITPGSGTAFGGCVTVTACFVHAGYIPTYGCSRHSFVGRNDGWGDNLTTVDINNYTSTNGGAWNFYPDGSGVLLIRKEATSYGGQGHYFVTVKGVNVVGKL